LILRPLMSPLSVIVRQALIVLPMMPWADAGSSYGMMLPV
jgi:hypothetical protein